MASILHFLLVSVGFSVLAADASPSCEDWQQKGVIYYNLRSFTSGSPIEANEITATDHVIAVAKYSVPSSDGLKVGMGSSGQGSDKVYAYAECYGLYDSNKCGNCLVEARNNIKNSVPTTVGGRLCTGQCSIRFEVYQFFAGTFDTEVSSKACDE